MAGFEAEEESSPVFAKKCTFTHNFLYGNFTRLLSPKNKQSG